VSSVVAVEKVAVIGAGIGGLYLVAELVAYDLSVCIL